MLKCTLGDKVYTIPFVKGRAFREMDTAMEAYTKMQVIAQKTEKGEALSDDEKQLTVKGLTDVLVEWFCLLFENQFTPDDVYDNYPADRLFVDIVSALLKVNAQLSDTLEDFPTRAATAETATKRNRK